MPAAPARSEAVAVRRAFAVPGWLLRLGRPLAEHLPGERTDALAGLLLLGVSLAFYYPLVFLGRILVDYDAFVYFYPQRAYLGQSLLEGRLPLWNPYLFMGAPFLANPQTAVLYPPSWLFLLTPAHAVYTAQLVLHAALAALFTYLLGRRALGASALAAAVGGLAYGFGGAAVAQTGHLNQLSAAAWLPAVLLAYDRACATRRPAWVALGALALALQLFAGHPQVTYMTVLALGLFGLARAPWRQPRGLAWAALAGLLVGLVGAAIAAAQLLPTLELAPLSIRGQGVEWRDAVAGSLPSSLLPGALLPPFWLDVPSPEFLGYAGVAPVALGLLALLAARSRFVLFGFSLCFLGVFLALGENNGWYAPLFDAVPGFDTFRVPARWLLLWQLGVAVLGALGADWIRQGALVRLARRDLWPRLLLVAFLLTTGLAWQREFGAPFPQRRTPAVWAAIAAATVATGFLANLGRRRAAAGALVALAAAELWAAADASPARQAPPPALLESPGPAADWLREHARPTGRVLAAARADYIPSSEGATRAQLGPLPERVAQSLLVARKWRDTLTPNLPLELRLRAADGYDGGVLPLRSFLRLSSLLTPAPRPDGVLQSRLERLPDERTLDLLGVEYLLAGSRTPARPGLDAVELGDLRLYARRAGAPLSLLVFTAGPALPDDAALGRMAGAGFDPNREVVLAPDARVGAPRASDRPGLALEPERAGPERWQLHVSAPEPGYLLQREAWYPGWRARVDGHEAPVLRADVLFRAVPLSAGEHEVELFFSSPSLDQGLAISALGLAAAGLLLTWGWWRRALPRSRSSDVA